MLETNYKAVEREAIRGDLRLEAEREALTNMEDFMPSIQFDRQRGQRCWRGILLNADRDTVAVAEFWSTNPMVASKEAYDLWDAKHQEMTERVWAEEYNHGN